MSTSEKVVRVPITNVFGGGDYTGQIRVGSQEVPANVILDTGSSTLAVKETAYNPNDDTDLQATPIAQDITYGTGGWAGPAVLTNVSMGLSGKDVTLEKTRVAITASQQAGNFGQADGILGLAYHALDNAYNLKSYLSQHGVNPPVTWPWPFRIPNNQTAIGELQAFLQRNEPPQDLTPWFAQAEQQGLTPNKFAFYTLRSSVNVTGDSETIQAALQDPQNQGFFILGGGEGETDLYSGSFQSVKVVADAYYNTNLKYAQVEGAEPVAAQPLQKLYQPYAYSNSIIDSGTNSLALTANLYQGLVNSLGSVNPAFVEAIKAFNNAIKQGQGYPVNQLNLDQWPNISFVFEGDSGDDVHLSCTPNTYWQTNSPGPGQAFFKISGSPESGPNQSILGLPLMNNYYTIFDRSADSGQGVVRFASIKRS